MRFAIGAKVEIYRYSTSPDPLDPERKLTPPIGAVGIVRASRANRWIYDVEFPGFGVIEMFAIELSKA